MTINDPTRARNVIAFPQRRPRPGIISCAAGEAVEICAHCGGRLGEGESEDECSSAPAQRRQSALSLKWQGARSRSSNG